MNILFVCVENSGRSQLAEGFARYYGNNTIKAYSAGSKPKGSIYSLAVEVMKEKGIDLTGHKSKGFGDLPDVIFDYVVTMGCGDICPFIPGKEHLDWNIPDPKGQDLAGFRVIRDIVSSKVKEFIHNTQGI